MALLYGTIRLMGTHSKRSKEPARSPASGAGASIDPATPLARVGEWDALGGLLARLPGVEHQVLGAGDDAAALSLPPGEVVVISTDTLVEGVHFQPHWSSPEDLGYRLVGVAASDLAAMAAAPLGLVVALSAPGALHYGEFLGLAKGMIDAARDAELAFVGGDTTVAPQLVLTATVLGTARAECLACRATVHVGDRVLVTSHLGDAAAGLGLLQKMHAPPPPRTADAGKPWLAAASPLTALTPPWSQETWQKVASGAPPSPRASRTAVEPTLQLEGANLARTQTALAAAARRFLRPRPLLRAASAAQAAGATAMIDISDGLASELHHLALASGVGFRIVTEPIPVGDGARIWAQVTGQASLELALGGGEDFGLLCTAPASALASMVSRLRALDVDLVEIGEAVPAAEGLTLVNPVGESRPLHRLGYEHFAGKNREDPGS